MAVFIYGSGGPFWWNAWGMPSSGLVERNAPASITLDAYPSRTNSKLLTLSGKKTVNVSSMMATGADGELKILSNTEWEADIKLIPGRNVVYLFGADSDGDTNASATATITLSPITQEVHRVFNNVSEHGIPRALPQIIGEKNYFYKNRLTDVFQKPTNTTMNGVHLGINRELSLKYYPGFRIRSKRQADGTLGATNGVIKIDNCVLIIECDEFYVSDELVYVEPATDQFDLTYYPIFNSAFTLRTLDGDQISYTKFTVDRNERYVKLWDTSYRGQKLRVSYKYKYVTYLYDKTLYDLMLELEAVTINGRQLFECGLRDAQWPAAGLFPTSLPLGTSETFSVLWWARVRVRELHSWWFRQYILNQYGGAYDTKLEGWAETIDAKTSILWKDTQLDKHYWNVIPEEIATYGTLPHLYDSFRGHWDCKHPSHDPRYTIKDYLRYNGICPIDGSELDYVGVEPRQFQSGTGTKDDLMVSLTAFRTED